MKQEIYMAREIETKCIHLEEEENSINHYGAISYTTCLMLRQRYAAGMFESTRSVFLYGILNKKDK